MSFEYNARDYRNLLEQGDREIDRLKKIVEDFRALRERDEETKTTLIRERDAALRERIAFTDKLIKRAEDAEKSRDATASALRVARRDVWEARALLATLIEEFKPLARTLDEEQAVFDAAAFMKRTDGEY